MAGDQREADPPTNARTILVAGTASHVGKSTVAAGLCRLLADRGVDVAPFKAQNMSNNARAVPGGEVGVSQYVQARAARVPPAVDHNPVLLKPRGGGESQVIVDGEAVGHYEAGAYYDDHWQDARRAAERAHARLTDTHDVVVAEGAGSIAEINLHHRDLANVETARFADADVVLVADIERGGVFASVLGTLELVPADVRERVVGVLITKFRGDASLLDDGVETLESRTGVPVLGVLPHDDPGLPEEDSLALPPPGERTVCGDDDVPPARQVTVAVPRFPRISNFADLDPLAREPGVRVVYQPLDAPLDGADGVVLPGTKNTVDDLLACRRAGLDDRLRAFDGPVVGLCGGYQMLGERITNADVESAGEVSAADSAGRAADSGDRAVDSGDRAADSGERTVVEGFGLLPVETRFSEEKTVEPVTRDLHGVGPLAGADGEVSGYEIHMGDTHPVDAVARPFSDDGAATDRVLGTYLHGLFENRIAREAFLETVSEGAGVDRPTEASESTAPYDAAADLLRNHADLSPLGF